MVDDLDTVEWAALRTPHAARDATQIPVLLRSLARAADDRDAARAAGLALREALIHEHSGLCLPPATATVPFLVEICDRGQPEAAAVAADILIAMADGDWPLAAAAGTTDPDRLDGIAAATRSAVQAGRDVYYALLYSPCGRARANALYLLDMLEPGHPDLRQELARLRDDRQPDVIDAVAALAA